MQYAGCDKQFRTVLADPPWPGQSSGNHYPVMSLEQIRRLPVARLVGSGCAFVVVDDEWPAPGGLWGGGGVGVHGALAADVGQVPAGARWTVLLA